MSTKVNAKARLIQESFGISDKEINILGEKMASICALATEGKEPAGFISKLVVDTFSVKDLQIIATMFAVKTINENPEEEDEDEECQCPGCKAARGEDVSDDEMMKALKEMVAEKFPGMEAMVVKVPKPGKGKTDC